MVGVQFESLRGCVLASWVIGANMECKLFVALQLEVAHHFIERCAGQRTRRFEPPVTFGATKTAKMPLLNPYQLPAHGLCRCAPTLPGSHAGCSLPSGDEAVSFRSGVRNGRSLRAPNSDGLSGILRRWKILVLAHARFRGLI